MASVSNTRAYLFSGLYRQMSIGERFFPNPESIHGKSCVWVNDRFSHRDPGSKFAKRAGWAAFLPAVVRNQFLLATKRDGILLEDSETGRFVGSCFFQRHPDNSVHSFHYYLLEEMRGQGLGSRLGRYFIEYSRRTLDFSDPEARPPCARIFAGGSPEAQRIYASLVRHQVRLGIQPIERKSKKGESETGWFRFTTPSPSTELPDLLPGPIRRC